MKKIQAIEKKIQVVKRKDKEKTLGGLSDKRKRNGIIYLTRNNDGLSR